MPEVRSDGLRELTSRTAVGVAGPVLPLPVRIAEQVADISRFARCSVPAICALASSTHQQYPVEPEHCTGA